MKIENVLTILRIKKENQTRTHYGHTFKGFNKNSHMYATFKVNQRRIKHERHGYF